MDQRRERRDRSRPASRSSTCSPPTAAAARSACSAAPASARPCSSRSSSTTSPRQHGGYSVFAGVGERTREGNDLYHEMSEAKRRRPASRAHRQDRPCVFGQMNEPPGARARVALSALTDGRVLPRRGGQATCSCSSTTSSASRRPARRCPRSSAASRSAVGYQPTLATEMGELQERITLHQQGLDHLGAGHLRARRRPHRPGARPPRSPTSTRPRMLDRAIAEKGIYPAVDPLDSTSTHPRPAASSASATTRSPARCSAILQRYKDLQDIIAILGMDELSRGRQASPSPRPQDRRRFLSPAVLRRRAVHRPPGQVRPARGDDPRLRGDPRGQARRPARAGLLHGRHHRRVRTKAAELAKGS